MNSIKLPDQIINNIIQLVNTYIYYGKMVKKIVEEISAKPAMGQLLHETLTKTTIHHRQMGEPHRPTIKLGQ